MFARLMIQVALIGATLYAAPVVALVAGVAALVHVPYIVRAIARS